MKKTGDIIALPVLAVDEGDFVARVFSVIVNPADGKIEYLLLEGDQWFLEKKCLSLNDVTAIGTNAVTTEKAANVKPVSDFEPAVKLLQNEVKVLNSRVMTRDGRLLGTVTEFLFDPSTGKITGCELKPLENNGPDVVIKAADILTFGQKYLVVAETTDTVPGEETGDPGSESTVHAPLQPEKTDTVPPLATPVLEQDQNEDADEKNPLELFSEKQRQYLIGKKASKTIIDANGNIVVSEGTEITEEIIERATRVDKYIELTMCVE